MASYATQRRFLLPLTLSDWSRVGFLGHALCSPLRLLISEAAKWLHLFLTSLKHSLVAKRTVLSSFKDLLKCTRMLYDDKCYISMSLIEHSVQQSCSSVWDFFFEIGVMLVKKLCSVVMSLVFFNFLSPEHLSRSDELSFFNFLSPKHLSRNHTTDFFLCYIFCCMKT